MTKEPGSLRIQREDSSITGRYAVTFVPARGGHTQPRFIAGPESLIELLAGFDVDFESSAVREALKNLLLHGSACIAVALTSEQAIAFGLALTAH